MSKSKSIHPYEEERRLIKDSLLNGKLYGFIKLLKIECDKNPNNKKLFAKVLEENLSNPNALKYLSSKDYFKIMTDIESKFNAKDDEIKYRNFLLDPFGNYPPLQEPHKIRLEETETAAEPEGEGLEAVEAVEETKEPHTADGTNEPTTEENEARTLVQVPKKHFSSIRKAGLINSPKRMFTTSKSPIDEEYIEEVNLNQERGYCWLYHVFNKNYRKPPGSNKKIGIQRISKENCNFNRL